MPEGHTVHRIARLFDRLFTGSVVQACSPQGRFSHGAAEISGRVVTDSRAVGKQLFLTFDSDLVTRVHLGIYGAWDVVSAVGATQRAGRPGPEVITSLGAPRQPRRRKEEGLSEHSVEVFPPPPVGQVRLRLATDDYVADLRGPTACELISSTEAQAIMASLGPDPLVGDPRVGEDRFVSLMSRTSTPIGLALMNQKLVSGIGNVYRAELLFRHRLDPWAPARTLDDETLRSLWRDWSVLLADGVETGVMRTRSDLNEEDWERSLELSSIRSFVYGRAGQPCRVCGGVVQVTLLQARKLYWCPACQQGADSVTS